MKKPTILIQIVLATTITILSVAAIASATTIGTNISTGGTLSVTGATTLSSDLTVSGNTVFSGIATSTNALVASSTFQVFGTTDEGTGTFIETIANGTDVLGYTTSNGINLKKYDGTLYGTLGRIDVGGNTYVNGLLLQDISGDYGSYVYIKNSSGQDVAALSSAFGLIIGDYSVDTASSVDIAIADGSGEYRFVADGATGDLYSFGSLKVGGQTAAYPAPLTAASTTNPQLALLYNDTFYSTFQVDSSGDLTLDLSTTNATTTISDNFQVEGNLVASSTLQIFGTTREGTGTFIETIANGTDVLGYTSNGINLLKNDGTIFGTLGRMYINPPGIYSNTLILKQMTGDYSSALGLYNDSGEVVVAFDTTNGMMLGASDVDTASSVDFKIFDGSGGNRFQIDGATGNATSTGTFGSTRATDLGWSVVAGANTACNTTCTNACVFGFDDGATTIVGCTDAAADKCVCAGPS